MIPNLVSHEFKYLLDQLKQVCTMCVVIVFLMKLLWVDTMAAVPG